MKSIALFSAFVCCIAACASEAPAPENDTTTAPSVEVDQVTPESVAGCVSIQWCNAPGGLGTVCQVKASCQSQCPLAAIQTACHNEARAVCGTIIQPFAIACNH